VNDLAGPLSAVFQLGFNLAAMQITVADSSRLVDHQHGGQRENAHFRGQFPVASLRIDEMGPVDSVRRDKAADV